MTYLDSVVRGRCFAAEVYIMSSKMALAKQFKVTNCARVLWCCRYPSSVFVGDTYTYFAGMALAVVGILGHFR